MDKILSISESPHYVTLANNIEFMHNLTCYAQVQLRSKKIGKVTIPTIEVDRSTESANLTDADASLELLEQHYLKKHICELRSVSLAMILVFCFGLSLHAQDFKSVGYLPHYRFDRIAQIDFEKVTHVNISFANPDMQGNLSVGDGVDIEDAVIAAHASGVKVYVALAGGYLTPQWAAAWKHNMKEANRSAFIHKIMEYLSENDLDGVDMDLEWSHVDEYYSPFVMELSDSLKQKGLPFTAALPAIYRYPEISDDALGVFDWINIMAYDLRGGWNPSDAGPHSPYSFAVSSMNYWINQGVAPEQLTLGLPFYGYDFSDPTKTVAMTFAQIVEQDPSNAQQDSDGNTYYNGIPTIVKKTELAMANLSGIMIWELGQDDFGEFSLLDAIFETINGQSSSVQDLIFLESTVFPNPFDREISIDFERNLHEVNVRIFDITGSLVYSQRHEKVDQIQANTQSLGPGSYILYLVSEGRSSSRLIIKLSY